MATLAMWFQGTETISSGNAKLLMIFIGLVAVTLAVQAVVQIAVAVKSARIIKDLSETAEDFKVRLLPLIASATEVSRTSQTLLREIAPKVELITNNLVKTSDTLVETSELVRGSAQRFDSTIADANMRAQHQMARIDGMVTAALTTTTEIVETINNGIRGPAQKIAGMASQLRYGIEGIIAKVKSRVPGSPFGNGSS